MTAKKHFCSVPQHRRRVLPADIDPRRARLLHTLSAKWVNGTKLRFYFFSEADGQPSWTTADNKQKDIVRKAFAEWKEVGIGLEFQEVDKREDADIRIAFEQGAGSWSYVGREIREQPRHEPTMNFGWNLEDEPDTALHEIGHTLGVPHEHQNPNAGISWNEEAVYEALAKPPNSWSREKTFYNIIRKLVPESVRGSN